MKAGNPDAVVRAYRDLALVDREDASCGMVDDVEVVEVQPGVWDLAALLVGPGALRRRRPRWISRLLFNRRVIRIDAADVAGATSVVRLLRRCDELGLAPVERRLLKAWRKLPPIDN